VGITIGRIRAFFGNVTARNRDCPISERAVTRPFDRPISFAEATEVQKWAHAKRAVQCLLAGTLVEPEGPEAFGVMLA
jgi:hypothetical protein